MKLVIKEGNYTRMGVMQIENQVFFTFEGEKEDRCCVVLVDKRNGEHRRIEVPKEYCIGSLRSVAVGDMNAEDYNYYYEINGRKIIDPYATKISGREIWNDKSRKECDYEILGAYSKRDFQWDKDVSPEIPKDKVVMYKLHVRGFTKGLTTARTSVGTFAGVTSKINYLKNLGFTTIEFMPVYEFEEMECALEQPNKVEMPEYVKWEPEEADIILPLEDKVNERLNYWGYGEGNYFAVKASYAKNPERASEEFQMMVSKLHEAGMECVLEMFFTGQTNHNLILDVLRFWVREYHVDGFHLLGEGLPITAIVQDSLLSRTKIFYSNFEYHLSNRQYQPLFVYKDEYMYPARKLLNHMNGEVAEFLDQQKKQGEVLGYVNYITSNNGFTLADIFMYNDKHNETNGENNLDGNQWNFSNNYGVEGPTRRKYIRSIRSLKWRNAMMMLFMAQGVPMIWSGDEMGNSQNGNNNAYCQDNEIGWLNWKNERSHKNELEFLKRLIEFRKKNTVISQAKPFRFQDYKAIGVPDLSYHGEDAWVSVGELGNRSVGVMYAGEYVDKGVGNVYVGYNFYSARVKLALPKLNSKRKWYMVADSTVETEAFFKEPVLCENQQRVTMNPQAICILVGM